MKINLPFKPQFRKDLINGRKTCTSRTKKFGNPTDTFDAFGEHFFITNITLMPLNVVATDYYYKEGFNKPAEFISCWNSIHPIKRFNPEQKVYVHEFKKYTKRGEING